MEQNAEQAPRTANDSREKQPKEPVWSTIMAQPLSTIDQFRKSRPSKKATLFLMLAAAALTAIAGFNWGGWLTTDAARQMVSVGSQEAVLLRLAPMCVAQFNLDANKTVKLDALKAITTPWERASYIKDQGWATLPGETMPDNGVADACTALLMGG